MKKASILFISSLLVLSTQASHARDKVLMKCDPDGLDLKLTVVKKSSTEGNGHIMYDAYEDKGATLSWSWDLTETDEYLELTSKTVIGTKLQKLLPAFFNMTAVNADDVTLYRIAYGNLVTFHNNKKKQIGGVYSHASGWIPCK